MTLNLRSATVPNPQALDRLLGNLHALLGPGPSEGISGRDLAEALEVSERTIRELTNELIDRGFPVGSSPAHGYFLLDTSYDFDLGTRHLRSRALSMLSRVKKLRAIAALSNVEPDVLRLFDLEEVSP